MIEFPGKIGRTVGDSIPWWPTPKAEGSLPPNVITIIFDDTGWSDFGCFGSEVKTPNIDALAAAGLRYTNFHVTPLCSPTRAAFLTGRNHHSVGMRCLADTDTGFPNSRGALDASVALLPELMRGEGYGTYMVGKWHLTPAHEITPAGPHSNWPMSKGFDRYYGFLGGCTDQYAPELVQDNHTIDPPLRDGYHLSEDLCDRAITYLRDHAAFRKATPFFLNFAFGATHAPLQVEKRYIDPYVPVFEKGWDRTREDRLARQKAMGLIPDNTELVERNPEVPAWDSLDADEKRVFCRLQSAYAGFLEHTDEQIGRLVDELKRLGMFDNTIILIFSDNGASREGGRNGAIDCNAAYSGHPEQIRDMIDRLEDVGGPKGPAHYPEGWAMAGNTPFRRYKQYVELGGVRSPLVMSWPMGVESKGEIRHQFLHVIDLAPTLMDLVGNRQAAPFDGASFRATLSNAEVPAPRNIQYWEMFGRRAIYCDGWKAVSEHEKGDDYGNDVWRLYDTRTDFSECRNLALQHPDKLEELKDVWWQEAESNRVMPLDDRTLVDIIVFRQPNGLMSQREITLHAGQGHISQPSMITSSDRSMDVEVRFSGQLGSAEGVLLSVGDDIGGYSFYVCDGKLVFEHVSRGEHYRVEGSISHTATDCRLAWRVRDDNSAYATLHAGDKEIASSAMGSITHHLSFWGMDVGRDAAKPVSREYQAPFALPEGKLDRLVLRFFEDVQPETVAATAEAAE